MFQKFKNFPVFIVAVFIIAVLGLFLFSIYFDYYSVEAGTADNVTGYAWSDNIGWISFNNTSDGSGIDYGVNIDSASGDLSGYAWSDNIGWISFNRSDTGNPPVAPFNGGSGPIAKYNIGTGELTGWMRVLANGGGWDGWIKFCDSSCSATDFARVIDGVFVGWAWSDMVVGWMSLSGSGYQVVFNLIPNAENLRNNTGGNFWCANGPTGIILSWDFNNNGDGDSQSAYQVQITRSDGVTYDSGKRISGATSITAPDINSTISDFISYNYFYNWQVMVWDSFDASAAAWAPASFATPVHAWPDTNFFWSPNNPSAEEPVTFNAPSQPAGVNASFDWSGDIADASGASITVTFPSSGTFSVKLTATDSDHAYSCDVTKQIRVKISLPEWQEIAP